MDYPHARGESDLQLSEDFLPTDAQYELKPIDVYKNESVVCRTTIAAHLQDIFSSRS